MVHRNALDQILHGENYHYDDVSNIYQLDYDSQVATYGYSDANELTSELRPGLNALYTYDDNGNRHETTINGAYTLYNFDNVDRLTSAGTTSLQYDTAGRCFKKTDTSGDTLFALDYEDRITQITYPDLTTNTFAYNGLGSMVGKNDSSGSYTYFRNGSVPGSGIISDSHATYTGVVSERRGGASKWMHQGVSGSNVLMTDASGNVTDTRTFDAFGNKLSSSGTTQTPFGYGGGFGLQEVPDLDGNAAGGMMFSPGLSINFNHGCGMGSNPVTGPSHRLRPMIAAVDGEGVAFLPSGASPRTPEEEFEAGAWYGFQTSLAALGHSLSFGLWDGGKWKDAPGFAASALMWDIATIAVSGAGVAKGAGKGMGFGIKANRARGLAAQAMVHGAANTARIAAPSGKAAYRIPDILDRARKIIGEVKNVKRLACTAQIMDILAFAEKEGHTFWLFVRMDTELSPQLLKLIEEGRIILSRMNF